MYIVYRLFLFRSQILKRKRKRRYIHGPLCLTFVVAARVSTHKQLSTTQETSTLRCLCNATVRLLTVDTYYHFVLLLLSLPSGVRLATVTIILSSSFLSSPHFSLTAFSINSLQFILCFAIVLHSPPTLSKSHSQSSSPPSFLPLSGYLLSLPIFHLRFFPHVMQILPSLRHPVR